eukprot:scaffold6.g2617.t1
MRRGIPESAGAVLMASSQFPSAKPGSAKAGRAAALALEPRGSDAAALGADGLPGEAEAERAGEGAGTGARDNGEVFQLVSAVLSAGVLGMPFAFRVCGVGLATALVLVMLVAAELGMRLLMVASQLASKRSYAELARHSFGRLGQWAVELSVIANNVGSLVAYQLILVDLFSTAAGTMIPAGAEPNRNYLLLSITLLGVLPVALFVRSPHLLSSVSQASVAFLLFFCAVVTVMALAAAPHAAAAVAWRFSPSSPPSSAPTSRRTHGNIVRNFGGRGVSGLRLAVEWFIKMGYGVSILAAIPLLVIPLHSSFAPCIGLCADDAGGPVASAAVPLSLSVLQEHAITIGVLGASCAMAILLPNVEFVFGLAGSTASVLIAFIMPAAIFLQACAAGARAGVVRRREGGGPVHDVPARAGMSCATTGSQRGMLGASVDMLRGSPLWRQRRRMAAALLVFGVAAGLLCTHALVTSIQEEAEVVQLAQELVREETRVMKAAEAEMKAKQVAEAVGAVSEAARQLDSAKQETAATLGSVSKVTWVAETLGNGTAPITQQKHRQARVRLRAVRTDVDKALKALETITAALGVTASRLRNETLANATALATSLAGEGAAGGGGGGAAQQEQQQQQGSGRGGGVGAEGGAGVEAHVEAATQAAVAEGLSAGAEGQERDLREVAGALAQAQRVSNETIQLVRASKAALEDAQRKRGDKGEALDRAVRQAVAATRAAAARINSTISMLEHLKTEKTGELVSLVTKLAEEEETEAAATLQREHFDRFVAGRKEAIGLGEQGGSEAAASGGAGGAGAAATAAAAAAASDAAAAAASAEGAAAREALKEAKQSAAAAAANASAAGAGDVNVTHLAAAVEGVAKSKVTSSKQSVEKTIGNKKSEVAVRAIEIAKELTEGGAAGEGSKSGKAHIIATAQTKHAELTAAAVLNGTAAAGARGKDGGGAAKEGGGGGKGGSGRAAGSSSSEGGAQAAVHPHTPRQTNFKTQVEADIQPFRGILLGLFFVTTGSSLDVGLLLAQWPVVGTLLVGLLALKITIIAALGPYFGLSKAESIRTGFVLSQGGEFAFVLLALANSLNVLPEELNRLLIIVVVLSMALTPALTEVGRVAADWVGAGDGSALGSAEGYNLADPVLICGFGGVGQSVANMLESESLGAPIPYVAFDLTVQRVQAAQAAGFNVLYGDGSRAKVLHAAGIERPRAVVVGYTARQRAVSAVEALRESYPEVPIYARALDLRHASELQAAGATAVTSAECEAGLALGAQLAEALGAPPRAAAALAAALREDMRERQGQLAALVEARAAAARGGGGGAAAAAEAGAAGALRPTSGGVFSVLESVFKFDQSKAPAFASDDGGGGEAPGGAAAPAAGALASLPGGGILAKVLSSVTSSGASSDEDDGAVVAVATGSAHPPGDTSVESLDQQLYLDGSFMTFDDSVCEGDLPDGSFECPLAWDAMDGGADTGAAAGDGLDAL